MIRIILPFLLTTSLLSCAYQTQAQAPAKQWDRTFGGDGSEAIRSLQQTSDGGYILGGESNSPYSGDKTQTNRGSDDYWVVKVDANGTMQWDKTFGGSNRDLLRCLKQTRDGGYLVGGDTESGNSGDKTQASRGMNDYWVVKIDASGNKQWDKTLGGNLTDFFFTLQETADGGCVLGGVSASGISGDKTQSSQGGADYWIIKLDASGNKQWDKTFGGSNHDYLYSLQRTGDGGFILGGFSHSPISGDKTQPNLGNSDYWVVKVDANGVKQWDKTLGGDNIDLFKDVQQTSDGGYILAGSSFSGISGDKTESNRGVYDYWAVKLDASGNKQWDRTVGSATYDYLERVQQTTDGGYLLGGTSYSSVSADKTAPGNGDADYWLVKLDANGTKQWDRCIGGSGSDALFDLEKTTDGGYVLGGYSGSNRSGDKTQPMIGGSDMWLVKLTATPLATSSVTVRPPLTAYPNPARRQFTLRGPLGTPYHLLNQLGQVVVSGRVSAQPMDVQALSAGLYLLRDETSGRTSKFVKE